MFFPVFFFFTQASLYGSKFKPSGAGAFLSLLFNHCAALTAHPALLISTETSELEVMLSRGRFDFF